eukprot:scaffold1817_cov250-Pinguiococcus_pyrenoidosus.AAC.14
MLRLPEARKSVRFSSLHFVAHASDRDGPRHHDRADHREGEQCLRDHRRWDHSLLFRRCRETPSSRAAPSSSNGTGTELAGEMALCKDVLLMILPAEPESQYRYRRKISGCDGWMGRGLQTLSGLSCCSFRARLHRMRYATRLLAVLWLRPLYSAGLSSYHRGPRPTFRRKPQPSISKLDEGMEHLYGLSPVYNALVMQRRDMKTLFVHENPAKNAKKESQRFSTVLQLAREMDLNVVSVDKGELNNKCDGRPHQGVLLLCSEMEPVLISDVPKATVSPLDWVDLRTAGAQLLARGAHPLAGSTAGCAGRLASFGRRCPGLAQEFGQAVSGGEQGLRWRPRDHDGKASTRDELSRGGPPPLIL